MDSMELLALLKMHKSTALMDLLKKYSKNMEES